MIYQSGAIVVVMATDPLSLSNWLKFIKSSNFANWFFHTTRLDYSFHPKKKCKEIINQTQDANFQRLPYDMN